MKLEEKIRWIQRLYRETIIDGELMTSYMRDLYVAKDYKGLVFVSGLVSERLLFRDVMRVCNGQASLVGDNLQGYRVVGHEPN